MRVARFTGFTEGGSGARALAQTVVKASAGPPPPGCYLYELSARPEEKIAAVAAKIYGAGEVTYSRTARRDLEQASDLGFGALPVCIAKTHLALTDGTVAAGGGRNAVLAVESVRVAAGAGYLLALAGDIVTMPGLPSQPAAQRIDLTDDGKVTGIVEGPQD